MSTPFRFLNADNTTVDFEDYYVRADYFRSGNLWTWGDNSYGELGDNTIVRKSSPVQTIAWGSNWSQVDVGWLNTAAIKTDGTLWLWGDNSQGQLGDNTLVRKSSPVQTVAGGTNWKQVSCSKLRTFTAAIKTDGTLWCWGDNTYGQLGDNTIVKKSSPVQTVAGGTNWKQVFVGGLHAAAIKTDGTLWTWGNNGSGQLAVWGGGSPASAGYAGTSPVTVSGSRNGTIAIFLTSNTTGVSVGMNVYTSTGFAYWTTVTAINTNVSITFNTNNNVSREYWTGTISLGVGAIKPSAEILDFTNNRSSPVQTVAFGTNWKQAFCGTYHTGAIKTDGTLWTWGYNSNGHLGDNTVTTRSSPVQTVAFGTNWMQVSASRFNTAAIKTDGTLWLWGDNTYGQLGDNTIVKRSSPVQTIAYGANWKSVSCGYDTTGSMACMKTDGTLWTFGDNFYGELGDNTTVKRSSPVQTIAGGSNWKQVSSFRGNTAAIQYQDDYQ